jgi:hypothetical protein
LKRAETSLLAAPAVVGPQALAASQLCTLCDPAQFAFDTTQTAPRLTEPFGHSRAVDAVAVALDIAGPGYNLFVLGQPGSGRHEVVRGLVQAHAGQRAAPLDWCYLHNFADPNRPRALGLPAGEGSRLRAAMQRFAEEVGKAIEVAFESQEYRSRIEAIEKEYKRRESDALQALVATAAEQGLAVLRTPQGFAFAPTRNGQPMTEQQVEAMTDDERQHIATAVEQMRVPLDEMLQQLPRMRRDTQTGIRQATRDTMGYAAGHLIQELKEQFAQHASVLAFLDEVLKDIIDTGQQMREQRSEEDETSGFTGSLSLI